MQAPDKLSHLIGLLVPHTGGRLVEKQQARPQRQRHCDLGGSLIAVGELADKPAGFSAQARELEYRLDLRADPCLLGSGDPRPQPIPICDLRARAHVLEYRELREDLGDLERTGDAQGDSRFGRKRRDITSFENDRSAGRREQPADEVEKGRLTCSVRTDDRTQLAFLHGERYVVHRDQVSESLGGVADLQDVHARPVRRMKPSNPRGKNSTMTMNSNPTNDIQLTVRLER